MRLVCAVAATATLAAAIALYLQGSVGSWVLPALWLGPDIAFLVGVGETGGRAPGQMPDRAVRPYNLLHRMSGPIALFATAVSVLPPSFLVGALLWTVHTCFERALGYGLGTPAGWRG